MTVAFTNLTDSDMVGSLNRSVGVQGFSSTIPEPETYAMRVAGLGLLTFHAPARGVLVYPSPEPRRKPSD